jgi:DNA topoisomerase-1
MGILFLLHRKETEMGKTLIIVESPNKIRTLKKFLGPEYDIRSSLGHIRNLPRKKLGVDIKKGFIPEYITEQGKEKIIRDLKKAVKNVDTVYLAPDPDREGEAISWHLSKVLSLPDESDCRITFNAITKSEVLKSLSNPRRIDINLVNAQQSRRVLDRLVGYKLSPVLWEKIHKGLSAGRVQSVAMLLICQREEEIFRFEPQEFWNFFANLKKNKEDSILNRAKLVKKKGKKIIINNSVEADKVELELKGNSYIVNLVDSKKVQRQPAPPFITSTLQQVAAKNLGFSVRKTMMLAQQLYEGVDIGSDGPVGLITYMRTDSTRTAAEGISMVRDFIQINFGDKYQLEQPRSFTKKKNVQDAHECIRPTSLENTPEFLTKYLTRDQMKLYTFIFNRFIASQMAPAVLINSIVEINNSGYIFVLKGSKVEFDGFQKIYNISESDEESENELPVFKKGEVLFIDNLEKKQSFTQPPPRFSEGTLVKELEKNGVGRPSTYAVIISTILKREYVKLQKKQFIPTELGLIVNHLLRKSFSEIINIEFTAKLEESLDKIADGHVEWHEILEDFYKSFEKILHERTIDKINIETDFECPDCKRNMIMKFANKNRFFACSGFPECKKIINISETAGFNDDLIKNNFEKVDIKDRIDEVIIEKSKTASKAELTDISCNICGKKMVIREGANGKFLGCSGFPKCRNTQPLEEQKEPESSDQNCDKCGKSMVIKFSRSGKFLACSGYPECKNTKSLPLDKDCPKEGCNGKIVFRRGKRGVPFYGCSNYPECDFTSWKRPE